MSAVTPVIGAGTPVPPVTDRRRTVIVPLLALPLALTSGAIWVLADAAAVDAGAVVRAALVVAFIVAGHALWRRPAVRPLGVVVVGGLCLATVEFLCSALAVGHRSETLSEWCAAAAAWCGPVVLAVAFHGLVALPDGCLSTPTERRWVYTAYAAATIVGGVRAVAAPEQSVWPLLVFGVALSVVGGALSHRTYLRARGAARQRMQWLGLALALVIETAVVVSALRLLLDWPPRPGVVVGASLVLVAGALVALASPRLVGRVDRLLTHAVSAAGLSAVVVAVYLVVVVGLGRVPTDGERSVLVLSMLAAAVSAVLYLPARARLGVMADRLVYGAPQDPTQALDTFGSRMTRALPMDELLLQLAELCKKHFALRAAEVWTGVDGRLQRAASVPDTGAGSMRLGAQELPVVTRAGVAGRGWAAVWLPQALEGRGEGPIRIAPMTHAGQLFGLLVLERPSGEDDFSEEDDRILTELARQVGLALQNSELDNALKATLEEVRHKNAELQESRARIVASGDAARRSFERNLHDGAQQHLVALAVKLRLIERIAESNPEQAIAMIDDARNDVLATVEEVRALAHGIYPPLLMDRGLPEALRAAAGRATLPTEVRIDDVGRFPQDVEAAVYFCCLEAVQNACKHAGDGAAITVSVWADDDGLHLEVADDGAGFDLAERGRGHGFVNMADRLGAIGGSVRVWSAAGQGTKVNADLPGVTPLEAQPST